MTGKTAPPYNPLGQVQQGVYIPNKASTFPITNLPFQDPGEQTHRPHLNLSALRRAALIPHQFSQHTTPRRHLQVRRARPPSTQGEESPARKGHGEQTVKPELTGTFYFAVFTCSTAGPTGRRKEPGWFGTKGWKGGKRKTRLGNPKPWAIKPKLSYLPCCRLSLRPWEGRPGWEGSHTPTGRTLFWGTRVKISYFFPFPEPQRVLKGQTPIK